jgi:hypothetical protein
VLQQIPSSEVIEIDRVEAAHRESQIEIEVIGEHERPSVG